MSPTLQSLGIDQLTVEQKIALAQEIWDSIAAEVEAAPLTEAQKREIDRRLADHRANPEDVIPWEKVQAEVLDRLKKLQR
jgi:putative addiction module component (TIGR02574 family)